MSEPISRRKLLVDYRISTTKCKDCGRVYFPPKSFCDKEGRASQMANVDRFYDKGVLYTGSVINATTKKFNQLGTHLSAVVDFTEDDFKIPGRITDFIPPSENVNISN